MQRDHILRLALSLAFFSFGVLNLAAAFVPVYWPTEGSLVLFAFIALAASLLLGRAKITEDLCSRAPSGRVKILSSFFGFVGLVAIIPAVLGFALFLHQTPPFGHGARTYPASLLALFALHPLGWAYALLVASGRNSKKAGAGRSGP